MMIGLGLAAWVDGLGDEELSRHSRSVRWTGSGQGGSLTGLLGRLRDNLQTHSHHASRWGSSRHPTR